MSSKQIRRPAFYRSNDKVQQVQNTSPQLSQTSPTLNIVLDDFLPKTPSVFDSFDHETVEEKCVYDLTFHLTAYDGTPIIIVPENYFDVVAQSFTAGMYGFDTESDCQTGELRIIQIYTGKEVYIFPAKALDKLSDNFLVKFMKSKDRLKIGVDIDTDCYRLRRHVSMRKTQGHYEQKLKHKFTINGCIDLQSIARSLNETIMGLEDLGCKYVEGFEGNPSNLGAYNPPTDQQYIYAANDAIVSLKIYQPLLKLQPSSTWLNANSPEDEEEQLSPIVEKLEIQSTDEPQTVVDDEPETPLLENPPDDASPEIEVKPRRKRKVKKNKAKKNGKRSPVGKHEYRPRDEIEEALKAVNQISPLPAKAKTPPLQTFAIPEIDEELKSKLRQRVDKLKQTRVNPISLKTTSFREMKAQLNQDRLALKESAQDVNDVLQQVKELFDISNKQSPLIRCGQRFRTFKELITKDDRVLKDTVERMIEIEKELLDQDYYDCLGEVAVHLVKQGLETIEYNLLLHFMTHNSKTINRKYPEATDRILAANILINMALDNDSVETVTKQVNVAAGPGVSLRLVR